MTQLDAKELLQEAVRLYVDDDYRKIPDPGPIDKLKTRLRKDALLDSEEALHFINGATAMLAVWQGQEAEPAKARLSIEQVKERLAAADAEAEALRRRAECIIGVYPTVFGGAGGVTDDDLLREADHVCWVTYGHPLPPLPEAPHA